MSLYRGAGGASDATDDSTVNAVAGYASAAASSATAAAASASTASSNADAAAASAASAASNVSQAATSSSNALTSESNASTSATNAASSASAAAASATAANISAGEASSAAAEATSRAASSTSSSITAGNRATAAAASATAAAASAASALAIYGDTVAMEEAVADAVEAAANAQQEAQDASDSAVAAAASAAAAEEHEQNAGEWASQAQGSANSAASSASSALAIFGNTSAMNQAVQTTTANAAAAASSATASATSATNSANSATASANSATAASGSATAAANSAAAASAVVLGNEPVRPSVRPSLLLDFANTRQLDPRITFTRASTATFYNGRTVAKAEENLLIRSEEFDNAVWIKTNTSGTANTSVAPDGTTTADTLTASAGNAQHFARQSFTYLASTTYSASVYAKAGTSSIVQISIASQESYANFDLSSGVVGTSAGLVSSAITSVGNGWYRCSITFTNSTGANLAISIQSTSSDIRQAVWNAVGTETILLWGAQLEQRSSVTAYTATTTAPITNYIPALQTAAAGVARFEHNPVTGESLGLEIEEQRTNLLLRSADFDDAAWSKTSATITANTIIAPDGSLSADKLVEVAANAQHRVNNASAATVASGSAVTFSFYVKAAERLYVNARIITANQNAQASYDAVLGTVTSTVAGSATITAVGNSWYRCTLTGTTDGTSAFAYININSTVTTTAQSYTGDGYSGIYIWGAQLEAGAFPTSYIPTAASQVTRSADAASMTGANFSSWYRADEGTMYGEYQTLGAGTGWLFAVRSDTNNYQAILKGNNGLTNRFVTATNAVNQGNLDSIAVSANTPYKLAGAYKVDDRAFTTNAAAVVTDSSTTLPVANMAEIGSLFSQSINGTIKKIAYYPRRVTNAELQGMTTV